MTSLVRAVGVGFCEGPVFHSSGNRVVVSLDHGCVYRIGDGGAEQLAVTGGGPNGATEGSDGRLYIAQNGGAWPGRRTPAVSTGGIQVVGPDGDVDWLTQDPISPNDLCFGPDGYLYVTDPTRNGRRDDGRLWRCDPQTGETELLGSVGWYPNGIGFGPERDAVYVASTGDATIKRLEITASGLGGAEPVIRMRTGRPDGFAFDVDLNLVIAAVGDDEHSRGSVQTWSLEGELLDEFHPGDGSYVTNVALSSDAELMVTDASGSRVVSVDWPKAGLPLYPFRKHEGRGGHGT